MGFGQAISTCLSNYANFNGRAAGQILVLAFRGDRSGGRSDAVRSDRGNRRPCTPCWRLCSPSLAIPLYAAGARRLHDTGKSGWLQLLVLIPCAGIIVMIVLWAQQGSGVDNQYGAPPA